MDGVLSFLFWLVVLVIIVWVAIFGTAGALIARLRDGSALVGFLWGALLGPIGLILAFFFSKPRRVTDDGGADSALPSPMESASENTDDYF